MDISNTFAIVISSKSPKGSFCEALVNIQKLFTTSQTGEDNHSGNIISGNFGSFSINFFNLISISSLDNSDIFFSNS